MPNNHINIDNIQNRNAKVQELVAQLIPLLTSKDENVKKIISNALSKSGLPIALDILCVDNEFYVTMMFIPSSEREDGTPIALNEISGYKITYGRVSGEYTAVQIVDRPRELKSVH